MSKWLPTIPSLVAVLAVSIVLLALIQSWKPPSEQTPRSAWKTVQANAVAAGLEWRPLDGGEVPQAHLLAPDGVVGGEGWALAVWEDSAEKAQASAGRNPKAVAYGRLLLYGDPAIVQRVSP